MESNNNNNNDNDDDGGDEHEQLRRSARNRLANDGDKPAEAAGEEDQSCSSKKNRDEGNDLLDMELESMSREDLVSLVRKLLLEKNEAQEIAKKKEAEESANRQAEILQLEQEKAELHAELGKNMAKIVEIYKEVEQKSEELGEKANQINTLLVQLIQSIREQQQHLMPPQEPMKIQLSLEIWYDWLGFVPRRRLGEIVPQIGDHRFASIVQKFLHVYKEITIDQIEIVPDPSGHPRVMAWQRQNHSWLRIQMAEAQMPANITNFDYVQLSYFDRSVLKFLRKFQQNGLLDNVTLIFFNSLSKDKIQPVLCHLLPLINGIATLDLDNSAQLIDIYDTGNSKEIYEMNMKMMEKTRLLNVRYSYHYDHEILRKDKIELYCRWLYQTARADGKPRGLVLYYHIRDHSPITLFIDRLKQDFLMATHPATFFIRIDLAESFQPHKDICLDNDKTNERLLIKTEVVNVPDWGDDLAELISRYPRASTKKWIMANEKEVSNWDIQNNARRICLSEELKVVPI